MRPTGVQTTTRSATPPRGRARRRARDSASKRGRSKPSNLGTEFTAVVAPTVRAASASPRGRSSGVSSAATTCGTSCAAGETVMVEPGRPGIIVRIESGNGTPAFQFPTIEPPSDSDYADASQYHASIKVVEGNSRPIAARSKCSWTDGASRKSIRRGSRPSWRTTKRAKSCSIWDRPSASARSTPTVGIRRGRPRRNERSHGAAPQRYTLYGYWGDNPPPAGGDPGASGWTLICRVDTDEFFAVPDPNRPPQQAVSVMGANGTIGATAICFGISFPRT